MSFRWISTYNISERPSICQVICAADGLFRFIVIYCDQMEKGGISMTVLPRDPLMLLSVVNMKLRDTYPSLAALCDDLDADREALEADLAAVGYAYCPQQNAFIPCSQTEWK